MKMLSILQSDCLLSNQLAIGEIVLTMALVWRLIWLTMSVSEANIPMLHIVPERSSNLSPMLAIRLLIRVRVNCLLLTTNTCLVYCTILHKFRRTGKAESNSLRFDHVSVMNQLLEGIGYFF